MQTTRRRHDTVYMLAVSKTLGYTRGNMGKGNALRESTRLLFSQSTGTTFSTCRTTTKENAINSNDDNNKPMEETNSYTPQYQRVQVCVSVCTL